MNNAKLFSDEAANIYERAISTLLKKNMLLYFAYADYEEVSKKIFIWTQASMSQDAFSLKSHWKAFHTQNYCIRKILALPTFFSSISTF